MPWVSTTRGPPPPRRGGAGGAGRPICCGEESVIARPATYPVAGESRGRLGEQLRADPVLRVAGARRQVEVAAAGRDDVIDQRLPREAALDHLELPGRVAVERDEQQAHV